MTETAYSGRRRFSLKALRWVVMAPVALVFVVFAVANRGPVSVDAWPFPFTIDIPVFLVLFSGVLVGFFWGAAVSWTSASGSSPSSPISISV